MESETETFEYQGRAMRLAATALIASLLIAGQLFLIVWRGEPACLNDGCQVIEALTRISPALFNLFGLLFFLAVSIAAPFARKRSVVLSLLKLLLLAAMAGEGVLLAYQYHIARVWCSYCLIIFGLVALCNIITGLRQFFSGLILVAAVNIMFAMLSFTPAIPDEGGGLAAGTAAIHAGGNNGAKIHLIYSNDCPHCMSLLRALPTFTACTIHLNPLGEPPPPDIQAIERRPDYQPEVNRLVLRLFGISTVPVLVADDGNGFRMIHGTSAIESYLTAHCTAPAADKAPELSTEGSRTGIWPAPHSILPPPADEECRVDIACPDPPFAPTEQSPAR